MLGQDEVIFKQFIMNLMEWRGRKGEMPTKPKDEGQGLMGSGVNAREFGYGWKLSAAELEVVNAFRREHRPNYADVDAATKVRGGSRKKDIETVDDSPFSVLYLNMAQTVMDIGHMTIWSCSWKTWLMY